MARDGPSTTQIEAITDAVREAVGRPMRRHGKSVAIGGSALTLVASLGGNALQAWEAHDVRQLRAEQEATAAAQCNERVGEAWRQYREHLREVHGL